MKKIYVPIDIKNARRYLNGVQPNKLVEHDFIYYALLHGKIINYSYDYEKLCNQNKPKLETDEFSIHIVETKQLINFCLKNLYEDYDINDKLFPIDEKEYEAFDIVGNVIEELNILLDVQNLKGLRLQENKIIDKQNLDKFLDLIYMLKYAIDESEYIDEIQQDDKIVKIDLPK